MKTFLHAGRLGDLIFGLAAMREMGGGKLYIHPHFRMHNRRRGVTAINTVMPLLHLQSYIDAVDVWNGESIDYDFREFPHHSLDGQRRVRNLVDDHRLVCGLPPETVDHTVPWLDIDFAREVPGCSVVFHRSLHYRNIRFPWRSLLNKFREQVFFIGLPEEYQDFVHKYGWLKYVPTKDIREVARLIAAASLFVGNQGAPFAVAEGLKKPVILEASAAVPSCIFPRPGMKCYWCGQRPIWPSVYSFPRRSDHCWEF